MTTLQIVLLVAGILAFNALLWIPALYFIKRRTARFHAELLRELEERGEKIVRGPSPTLYNGGSGEFSMVKGNGVAALTDRRLIVRKLVGKGFEIAVSDLESVREDKWFMRSYKGGRLNVIVKTRSGAEIGLIFDEHSAWMDAVRSLLAP